MEYCSLRWNNYLNEVTDSLDSLRNDEDLVDVTLSCEGGKLKAHKLLLSACSTYFRDIFKENPCQHPVIVFRNVRLVDLQAVVEYIYRGEVSVDQSQLESFLAVAQLLEVKGLSDTSEKEVSDVENASLRTAGTSEANDCDQASEASTATRKRTTTNYTDVEEPPNTQQNHTLNPKSEPDEHRNNVTFSSNRATARPFPILKDSTSASGSGRSSTHGPLETLQDEEPTDYTVRHSRVAADVSNPRQIKNEHETAKVIDVDEQVVNKGLKDVKKVSTEKSDEVPVLPVRSTTLTTPPAPLAKSSKTPAQETTDPFVSSKRIKLDVESQVSSRLPESAVKPAVTKENVHIPKGVTVTAFPVHEQVDIKLGDSYNAQPCDEDSVLRSENARTPVGEELYSEQQEAVGFTAIDEIQQDDTETAEEAPQLESEQATADVPPEEEPEFDYYGCEICKTEAKALDRLSFTHKCPICPCICFCSHLLKEHMKVIHGWFNVQRKFTQNY